LATAWAALEARASAKAAMKAVEMTANSLLETKKNFKQWLELLLEQHDSLYDEVKKELDSDSDLKIKNRHEHCKRLLLFTKKTDPNQIYNPYNFHT